MNRLKQHSQVMPNHPEQMILEMMGEGGELPPQEQEWLPQHNDPAYDDFIREIETSTGQPLHKHPSFIQAVKVFTEMRGHEPASDWDFDGPDGVMDIMIQIEQAGEVPEQLMRNMGEVGPQ